MVKRIRIRPKPAADRMQDELIGEHHPARLARCRSQLVLEQRRLHEDRIHRGQDRISRK
jgi:hypothetical protein